MKASKVVGQTKTPRTPAELYALGARLDRELSVVRPFVRKHGFVFKVRGWNELAHGDSQRFIKEQRQRNQ